LRNYSDLTIILPTLNEAENIVRIIGILRNKYKNCKIIVADDGSEDGTREKVLRLSLKNATIRLLDRSKERSHGLAISVLDSFGWVTTSKAVVMDADMQHPISKVGDISGLLDSNDLVIGVRTGVEDWGIHRRVLSKGMSYLSYMVFKIRRKSTTNDMMSGFFGIRRTLMSQVSRERERFVAGGYKILLDILRVSGNRIRIAEVRYDTFGERRKGRSKFRPTHVANTLVSTFKR
jgi:dolichol-phosphate mannosyltransferase